MANRNASVARDQCYPGAWFQQAHFASICGILLRCRHRWFLCVVNMVTIVAIQLYHAVAVHHCVLPCDLQLFHAVAVHHCVLPCDLQRIRTAFVCNCPASYFAVQACSRVSLLCSAFQRGHEHEVKSKVAVLQMLSRQIHNITHSLKASIIHVNANCWYWTLWQRLWNKLSLPRTIVLLLKRFTNCWAAFNTLSWCLLILQPLFTYILVLHFPVLHCPPMLFWSCIFRSHIFYPSKLLCLVTEAHVCEQLCQKLLH